MLKSKGYLQNPRLSAVFTYRGGCATISTMTKSTKKPSPKASEKRWVTQLTWLAVVAVAAVLVVTLVRVLK